MPVLSTLGRVCIALAGFVFMAVSTTGSSIQTSRLCALELGVCVDEVDSTCYLDEEVDVDAIWAEEP